MILSQRLMKVSNSMLEQTVSWNGMYVYSWYPFTACFTVNLLKMALTAVLSLSVSFRAFASSFLQIFLHFPSELALFHLFQGGLNWTRWIMNYYSIFWRRLYVFWSSSCEQKDTPFSIGKLCRWLIIVLILDLLLSFLCGVSHLDSPAF